MADNNNAPGYLLLELDNQCYDLIFVLYNSQTNVHKRFELEYQWYWCMVISKFYNEELCYSLQTISAEWLNEYLRLK